MATKQTSKIWQPNETQIAFINTLKNYPNGATLKDIELDTGVAFKTGAINTLVTKNFVSATDTSVEVDIFYRDTKIGTMKKNWKVYTLNAARVEEEDED